jgi:tetratricopeptide (TPR) repeat protein
MNNKNCSIYTSKLFQSKRKKVSDSILSKNEEELNITFCENDTLEKFETDLSILRGSSFIYSFKKRFSSILLSVISVVVIMFALISASIYEDLLKKILFEFPFSWNIQDTISSILVIIFFFGMLMMPSILDGEGSEFKNNLWAWFNKDIRKLKRLKLAFSMFGKSTVLNLYNFDLVEEKHWIWRLLVTTLFNRFETINFYIRNDQIQSIEKKLARFKIENITIIKENKSTKEFDVDILLSNKEQKLFSLMQLSSSSIIKDGSIKNFVSLELFEYCGRNFFETDKSSSEQLISGFQNFINRSFDDFNFITQKKSIQICFTANVTYKSLDDEQKRLAYYLRNHIEECITYFDNPISLLILYYYVKDIVLDEKRTIAILEKFISAVLNKQQYELVDDYWFALAGEMFDSNTLEDFDKTNTSFYRKLSIEALNKLIFLFERNGHFEQALLISKYLYEINPNKYSVNMCSLLERMGRFEEAYTRLPKNLNLGKNNKPSEIEVRYFQRKSWIVVSQRKDELKQEGTEALSNLNELLFSHNDDNEPLWLWHYYNIKANYAEWNEDYEQAIGHYKKCLAIPALGAFEYGATFVNMAIAYRLKYLEGDTKNFDIIDKSINLGKLGVLLKESVGDRDELPVVLHNQALNILCKMLHSPLDEKACVEIINITTDAISILDKTKSIKRLGMLLIENCIAKALLKNDFQDTLKRLESHISQMDENESNQLLKIYNEFKNVDKIEKISFL